MMWILLVASIFALGEAGRISLWGSCPTFTDARQIVAEKFIGRWYVIASMDDTISYHRCGAFDFLIDDDNPHALNLTVSYLHRMSEVMTSDPTVELIPRKPGQRIYDYKLIFGQWSVDYNYWITSTDYESWALFYVCTQSAVSYRVNGYFLARERNEKCLTNDQKLVIKKKMENVPGWDVNSFMWHDQSSCEN